LLEDLERTDEAIDAFAASAAKGHSADALVRLAASLIDVGRPADALVPADEARAKYPEDPRGWLETGRSMRALGRTPESIEVLRRAVELGGGPEASIELARALQAADRLDEALAALVGLEAPDAEAILLRCDVHTALGRTEEALADCDAAIRHGAEGRDLAYRRKGGLLLALDRPRDALAAFDAALGLNPSDADAWCDAALAWRAQGQETRATKMLEQALRIDPSHGRATRLRSESTSAPSL